MFHNLIMLGSSWINIYTTYFLTVAGIKNAFGFSIMMTCFGLLGVLFSITFVRRVDRRLIILIGVAACGLCQLSFAIAWTVNPGSAVAGRVMVAFITLFTFFYVAYGTCLSFALLHSFPLCLTFPKPHMHGFSVVKSPTTPSARTPTV